MSGQIGAVIFIFVISAVAALAPRRSGPEGGTLHMFRSLFPSWRFFEDVTEIPLLMIRSGCGQEELGPWRQGLVIPRRGPLILLLNPQGNLVHAANSLLQQLEYDIGDAPPDRIEAFETTVSFLSVKNLVLFLLRREQLSGQTEPATKYQFKVGRLRQGQPIEKLDPFLISKVYWI